MKTTLLAFAALFFLSEELLACSCATPPLEREKKSAALVFVGKVTAVHVPDRGEYDAEVTFEIYAAWKGRAPRSINVITSFGGGSCGYLPGLGADYLIFAHRDQSEPRLRISACSNHRPLACARDQIRRLGRPAVTHAPLPSLERLGEDDFPVPYHFAWTPCATLPEWVPTTGTTVPKGITMRDLSATIRRDGTVKDISFRLECAVGAAAECTDELAWQIRQDALRRWRFRPGTLNGKPAAMQLSYR